MPLGEALEITDAWLELPRDRERKVVVAAARALHRRADEFASATEALAALGLRFTGMALGPEDMALDDDVDLASGKPFKALAAGVEDGFMIIWDTRRGNRDVLYVDFDGAGHYKLHYLVWIGGQGCTGCLYEHWQNPSVPARAA